MIPLILTAMVASASSAVAVPTGSYTYKSVMNGTTVGSSTVTVKSIANGTELDEDGSGTFQGMDATAKATLTLSSDLTPFGYSSTYVVAGQNANASVTFANGSAALNSPSGSQAFPLGVAKHFAVLDGGMFAGFVALPAQMQAWSNTPVQAVAPMFGRSAIISVDPTAKAVRPAGIPANDSVLALVGPDAATLWYNPTTLVTDELDVPSQGLVVTRVR